MKALLTLLLLMVSSELGWSQLSVQRQLSSNQWEAIPTAGTDPETDLGERQLQTFPVPKGTFRIVKLSGSVQINPSVSITPLNGAASDFAVSGLSVSNSKAPDVFTVALQPTTLGFKRSRITITYTSGQSVSFVVKGDGVGNDSLSARESTTAVQLGNPIASQINFGTLNLS